MVCCRGWGSSGRGGPATLIPVLSQRNLKHPSWYRCFSRQIWSIQFGTATSASQFGTTTFATQFEASNLALLLLQHIWRYYFFNTSLKRPIWYHYFANTLSNNQFGTATFSRQCWSNFSHNFEASKLVPPRCQETTIWNHYFLNAIWSIPFGSALLQHIWHCYLRLSQNKFEASNLVLLHYKLVPLLSQRNLKHPSWYRYFFQTNLKHLIWHCYFCNTFGATTFSTQVWSVQFGTTIFATQLSNNQFGTVLSQCNLKHPSWYWYFLKCGCLNTLKLLANTRRHNWAPADGAKCRHTFYVSQGLIPPMPTWKDNVLISCENVRIAVQWGTNPWVNRGELINPIPEINIGPWISLLDGHLPTSAKNVCSSFFSGHSLQLLFSKTFARDEFLVENQAPFLPTCQKLENNMSGISLS